MDPIDLSIFQFIGAEIAGILAAFVDPTIAAFMPPLTSFTTILVALYIVVTGVGIVTGAIRQPFLTFLKQAAKIMLITAVALNVTNFGTYVLDFFRGLQVGLTNVLNPTSAGAGIYAALDATVGRGFGVAAYCFDMAGEGGLLDSVFSAQTYRWAIAGLLIGAATIATTVVGGVLIIVASFALALLFSIGPLFVLLLIFPLTSRFFDAWISQVIGFVLTVVLIGIVMGFVIVVFDKFLLAITFEGADAVNPFVAAGQVVILCAALVWMTFKSQQMAGMLGGGFSSMALSLGEGLAPGRFALRGAMSGDSALRGLSGSNKSTRYDLGSDRYVHQSNLKHRLEGNTRINPAYIQAHRDAVGKNWGVGGAAKRDRIAEKR